MLRRGNERLIPVNGELRIDWSCSREAREARARRVDESLERVSRVVVKNRSARGWTIVREINNGGLAARQAVFPFPPVTSLIIGRRDLYARTSRIRGGGGGVMQSGKRRKTCGLYKNTQRVHSYQARRDLAL